LNCSAFPRKNLARSRSVSTRAICARSAARPSALYRFGLTVPDSDARKKAVPRCTWLQHGRNDWGDAVFCRRVGYRGCDRLGRFFKDRYDLHFPKEVRFARHAMAIDEYRRDLQRVKWGGSSLPPNRPGEPDIFQQIWFAGNHADIGSTYPEMESRRTRTRTRDQEAKRQRFAMANPWLSELSHTGRLMYPTKPR
jgi:hypothetical protein